MNAPASKTKAEADALVRELCQKLDELTRGNDVELMERAAAALNDVLIEAGHRDVVPHCRHGRAARSCPWCRHLYRS